MVENYGFKHVSSDDIRAEYGIKHWTNDPREAKVIFAVHGRSLEYLMMGEDVVLDTTAMFHSHRLAYFDLHVFSRNKLFHIDAKKYLLSLDVSEDIWKQRQLAAGRDLGQIDFYRDRFEAVEPMEDVTNLRYDSNTPADLEKIKDGLADCFKK